MPVIGIDISITTKPYSYIGLIVDQNTLNIRTGNDLRLDGLMAALNSYELSDTNTPVGLPGKESGVITMSNTDYFIENYSHVHDPANTWIFLNVTVGNDGSTTIHGYIPSDMTSWVLSACSLDPITGMLES